MGYNTIDPRFYAMIDAWGEWYRGNVAAFHTYTVYNGARKLRRERATLNMGKKVCEDWADLLMNERVKINVQGEREQAFVDSVFEDNNFWVKMNETQELKAAFGTAAVAPYISGGSVSGGAAVKLNYITARNIYPLTWDSGGITECAFADTRFINGKNYVYLQIHRAGIIENLLFENPNNGGLKRAEDINSVAGFENVAAVVPVTGRTFVIDRLNITNNLDNLSGGVNPMGISVFAGAVDILKGADSVYDSYVNEFILGKKRVMVKAEATQINNGNPVFDPDDLMFYQMPDSRSDEPFIKEIDMKIRADEHEKALQTNLNLLSVKCGFGENHYSFERGAVKTATEVISQNSAMFRTLKKHELILEDALVRLTRIILRYGGFGGETPVTVDFDDSVIEDTAAVKAQAAVEFQTGLIDAVEYFVKVYNLTEEEAAAKVAKMEARKPKTEEAAQGIDWEKLEV